MGKWLLVGVITGEMAGVISGDGDADAVGDDGLSYSEYGKIIHYKAT
ncbi:unnamed protein product [marine sediment metagenome]|uniref:Uncharacterized protein n=1 Tax=marine sediment metagenome TaxID=412755 RepID=X1SDC9_9ZZZZ